MNSMPQPHQSPNNRDEIRRQVREKEAELQQLKARLEAPEEQLPSPTLSQSSARSESQVAAIRGNHIAFRKSQPGPGSLGHYSHDVSATKRPRRFTQSSAPPMSMDRSRSTQSIGVIPFTGAPTSGPRYSIPGLSPDLANPVIEAFKRSVDPFTGIKQPQTASILLEPDEYFNSIGDADLNEDVAAPSPQLHPPSYVVPPLTDSQTCPTLSPQPSVFSSPADNGSISGNYAMMRIHSNTSNFSNQDVQDVPNYSSSYKSTTLGKRPRFDDASVAQMGLAPCLQQVPAPDSADQLAAATSHPMSRAGTNTSMRSNASRLSERAKETLCLQNQRADATPLQPKPALPKEGRHHTPSRTGAAGKKKELTKPTYHRPAHPRVRCTKCDEYPEGFRGEHELRRHMDAKHSTRVAKWVCRDGGPKSEIQPEFPIDKCKACQNLKQYGAYYNAAAHLRRAHFNKSKKGGRKGSKGAGAEKDETNPAANTQEWPPMEDLKKFRWFYKIYVDVNSGITTEASQASLDDIEAPDDAMMPFDSQQPTPSDMSSGQDFASIGGRWSSLGHLSTAMPHMSFQNFSCELTGETEIDELPNTSPTNIPANISDMFSPMSYEFSPSISDSGAKVAMTEGLDMGTSLMPSSFDDNWPFGRDSDNGDQNMIFS